MKNEKTMKVENKRRDNKQEVTDGISEWYFEFIKDCPKNRDEVLGYFDNAIQHFADKTSIQEFLLNVKRQILEVEKSL